MFTLVWFTFLYQPLFNALIWIYSHVTNENLGWAVIFLTIFLRLALLPFTIISERNVLRHTRATVEAMAALKAFKADRLAQKQAARAVMKKYRISPWAKVVSLGIQAVVLVLLYQVFISGISGEKMVKVLYPGAEFPGKINASFYGFDIGARHDVLWAALAAIYLFISIYITNRARPVWEKSEFSFLFLFPFFTFLALWYLPMVKSLFILTTMVFSDIIRLLRYLAFSSGSKAAPDAPR